MTEEGILKKFFRMPRADGKGKIIPKIGVRLPCIFNTNKNRFNDVVILLRKMSQFEHETWHSNLSLRFVI